MKLNPLLTYLLGVILGAIFGASFPGLLERHMYGAVVCWLRRRHRWGRIDNAGCVTCRRCGHWEVSA